MDAKTGTTRSDAQRANEALAQRYARRRDDRRYQPLQPDVWRLLQDRQRAMLALFARAGWHDLSARRVVEAGCGSGGNLLEMLRLGCAPQNLVGIELLPARQLQARARLPPATGVWLGDAAGMPIEPDSQDLVLLFTVLSSLLEDAAQQRLADALWRWLKPGGAVLCYDLAVANPRNADVRAVAPRRLRQLFPAACLHSRRVTLAPPLARRVCRWHPALYGLLNGIVLLRSHRLTWIEKPPIGPGTAQ